ncbi:hypothetical protein [Roseisolibacter sp. H3M3-2]|uniref:hypothetical protein n=1 Tax=Roseisolibacter sp. H3M3-2 TaxID=3031323 RepID=UPI0023DC91A9|nr:hypothetical protein [Roseisolibacter sp. H3M3-2]MDF1502308.1 hypothetical protein [Roseisolibacter sp. H3M3-2]
MLPIVVVVALLLVAAAFAAASSRTISAAARHDELGRHRFLSAFNGRRLPAELLVQTYEALSRRVGAPAVALVPATALAGDLGLTRMDAEDLALLIAARCEGRIPTAHDLDVLDDSVRTVEDLLEFLHPFVAVPVAA